ncbi:MAG: GNAT family N-acetyltransferase [Lachnospiraceae bacterium]
MTKQYLRKAQEIDADILYEWANEAECRKNSFSMEPIAYEEHIRWLKRTLQDKKIQLYIGMSGENPIGQIRLNMKENTTGERYENQAIISYSIVAKQRGKGFGRILLELAEEKLKETAPTIKRMVGEVKKDNIPSQKAFEKNGYEKRIKEDCYVYVKFI